MTLRYKVVRHFSALKSKLYASGSQSEVWGPKKEAQSGPQCLCAKHIKLKRKNEFERDFQGRQPKFTNLSLLRESDKF